jgi:hypothetical protein
MVSPSLSGLLVKGIGQPNLPGAQFWLVSRRQDTLLFGMMDDDTPVLADGSGPYKSGREGPRMASDWTRFSLSPRHWRGLLRLRRTILRAQRNQDVDADAPQFVVLTDSSAQLLTHARLLAAENREDTEAVAELVRLANGNERALQVAALGVREKGEHRESSWADRAHRLLQAAASNKAIASVPEDEGRRLKLLDDFADLSVSQQWECLTELEPRLANLTGSLPVERLARHLTSTEVLELPQQERVPIRTARQAARESLKRSLDPIVGPGSPTDHPILRSQIAFRAALEYLMYVDGDYPHKRDN